MAGEKLAPMLLGSMKKAQAVAHPNDRIVSRFREMVHTPTAYEVYKRYLEKRANANSN